MRKWRRYHLELHRKSVEVSRQSNRMNVNKCRDLLQTERLERPDREHVHVPAKSRL
jgi:hypothetical protein